MPGADPITSFIAPEQVSSGLRHARARHRGKGFVAAVVAGALVLVVGGGAGALWLYQRSLMDNIEVLEDPFAGIDEASRPEAAPADPAAPAEPVNILLLGSDSRISAGDPSQWEAGAQRTDAIMLVHLPADRQGAQIISFPRDSWVAIPGYGEGKINAAFAYGGPSLMIATVEQLTGVRIQHFAVTDFVSFTTLTDALGGVDIRIPEDVGDGDSVFFEAGVHHMYGEEALTYARQRYGLEGGDFGRVQRQQNWMRAIMAKAVNSRTDVGAMNRLLQAVTSSVAVDENLTLSRMRELLLTSGEIGSTDVTFMTAPYTGTGRSPDGKQSIVVLDHPVLDPLMASVANDTVTQYVQDHAAELKILPATVK